MSHAPDSGTYGLVVMRHRWILAMAGGGCGVRAGVVGVLEWAQKGAGLGTAHGMLSDNCQ